VSALLSTFPSRYARTLLTLLMAVGCANRAPGDVRIVSPDTPETLVETCSPCSEDCVGGKRKQCIENKVHSEKAKSGGCLVYCVGRPEKSVPSSPW
jgi:hypothetical protein